MVAQHAATSGDGNSMKSFLESEQSALVNASYACEDKNFTLFFISGLLGGLDHNLDLLKEDNKFLRGSFGCWVGNIFYYTASGATIGAKIGSLVGPKGSAAGAITGLVVGTAIGIGQAIFKGSKDCKKSQDPCSAPSDFFVTPDLSTCDRGTLKLIGSNNIASFRWENFGATPLNAFTSIPELVITQTSPSSSIFTEVRPSCAANSQVMATGRFGSYSIWRGGIPAVAGIFGPQEPANGQTTYTYSVPAAGDRSLSFSWSIIGSIGSIESPPNSREVQIQFFRAGWGTVKVRVTNCDGTWKDLELAVKAK